MAIHSKDKRPLLMQMFWWMRFFLIDMMNKCLNARHRNPKLIQTQVITTCSLLWDKRLQCTYWAWRVCVCVCIHIIYIETKTPDQQHKPVLKLRQILTYRGTFLLLSSICGTRQAQTLNWLQRDKTEKYSSHVTTHCSFSGTFGSPSNHEEIIRLYLCQELEDHLLISGTQIMILMATHR